MKECKYRDCGSAYVKFELPNSKYKHSFKIDTGAGITLLPKDEFNNFFPNKKLESGEERGLQSASGTPMLGYTHKVLLHFNDYNQSKIVDVCFYSGKRALLGMDMIKKHFRLCFEKDNFFVKLP